VKAAFAVSFPITSSRSLAQGAEDEARVRLLHVAAVAVGCAPRVDGWLRIAITDSVQNFIPWMARSFLPLGEKRGTIGDNLFSF